MEPIDDLIRSVAPKAPRGIAEAVEKRIAAQRRTRRALVGSGAFVAAAAMLVLWLAARPTPAARESMWIAASATMATADGKPVATGRPLALGALVRVGDDGSARLERTRAGERSAVELGANTEARVGDDAIELSYGQALLEGPEARVTGDVADVTTLGVGAAATVELRRNPMLTKSPKAAALAALLSVGVLDGGARVAAKGHPPLLLAKNDRTLVAPKLPPVTTRAPTAKPVAKPTPSPAKANDAPPSAEAEGQLDKGVIRSTVQRHLEEVRFCYEQALAQSPHLGGKFAVRFTLVTKDGQSRVSEAEIEPADDSYLESMSMQTCVLNAVSRWRFPASADGGDVVVSYPFVFKSADDAE